LHENLHHVPQNEGTTVVTVVCMEMTTASHHNSTDQTFDEQFRALLHAWNTHHANRTKGASVCELTASRSELDAHRLDTRISLAS